MPPCLSATTEASESRRRGGPTRLRPGCKSMQEARRLYCNSQRPLTSFCIICTGLSSTPTPGPKRGTTKICRVSPDEADDAAFAAIACAGVSIGLLKVHIGRPRTGNQAGLTLVMAARRRMISDATRRSKARTQHTLQPDLVRAVELVEDDEVGWRAVEEVRGGVDKKIFLDSERAIGDAARRGDLGVREIARLVDEIFANGDLVDESGRQQLAKNLELRERAEEA